MSYSVKDGFNGQDLVTAAYTCGAAFDGLDKAFFSCADIFRRSANRQLGVLSLAYAVHIRSTVASFGFELIPQFKSDAAFVRWAMQWGALLSPVSVNDLTAYAKRVHDEALERGDFHAQFFWGDGMPRDIDFTHPEYVRACKHCQRLFFFTDARRTTCNHCQRKAERIKKRNQRGTDLSERICPVCSTSFTPKRSDARCCSSKCRAKLSRQEAKAAGPNS